MPESRQLGCIIDDLHADQLAALRQANVGHLGERIERQLAVRARGVRLRVRELYPGIHREKEAGSERVRNAHQISKVHGFGNPVHSHRKISTHGDSQLLARYLADSAWQVRVKSGRHSGTVWAILFLSK